MIKTMLVTTDGSRTAKAAAEYAATIAKCENAKVVVLSVVHLHQYGDTTVYAGNETFAAAAREAVDTQVEALRAMGIETTGRTWETETDFVQDAIEQVAEEVGADMIVMGTHGRHGLDRALLGSVADRVLRHSKVPMLVVPITYSDTQAEKERASAAGAVL